MRLMLAFLTLALAGCAPQEVTQTAEPQPGDTSEPGPAAVGDTINLTGTDPALEVAVRVEAVVDPAKGARFSRPDKNARFVGVQVRLDNIGTANYDDTPANGGYIIDAEGQQFGAYLGTELTDCQVFAGSVIIAPGDSRLGCIPYQIPKDAEPVTFQFTLNSGFGPETGDWRVG